MSSSSSSPLLGMAGWFFLPSMATNALQSVYYRLITPAGSPQPPPNSPRFNRDKRNIYVFVVLLYLGYTVYESVLSLKPNYYAMLGVPVDVDEKTLRSILLHPDKTGVEDDQRFIALRTAYETLSNPPRRFAYERFGEQITGWKDAITIKDYIIHGVQSTAPMYIVSGLFLVVMNVLGKGQFAQYWRFLTFFILMAYEALVITRSNFLPPFSYILPGRLPFEHLIIAHKLSLAFFVALNQIGPIVRAATSSSSSSGDESLRLKSAAEKLDGITKVLEVESNNVLVQDVRPFVGRHELVGELKRKMVLNMVEARVGGEGDVREVTANAVRRLQQQQPRAN
ncbi:hypothetical protein SAICODRAFT_7170 [Saitoella complicata NRRL Y-17804]|uniref:uncharacterized protein n=1 Tax=Saitoella complicata (strain BCRC 22490 / CBS 7301 / JCM 7358 / NBRC 10748 / NRRL Y-17804) TaxID=698492 RepID=UPI000866C141|nr:uncharacterized protein SAICODRAFT_7170 [Saitoella complicata NRRL Y-17804]ODQ53456.1 hypothetical protein SAICODRAFT_7170 [Saitoella complicata NRRL Y-17804]